MLENGTLVRILSGAALPKRIRYGRIVGYTLVSQPIVGAFYAVNVHEEISAEYPYEVIGIFEIHLEVVSVGIYGDILLEEEVAPITENVD